MGPTRRGQLIRQRCVAKWALTRMQTFIESDGLKEMRFSCGLITYKASFIHMTLHKMNWNYLMTQIILVIENYLKISTKMLRLRSVSFYILWLTLHSPGTAHYEAVGQETAVTLRGHIRVANTLSCQPLHCQPLKVTHVVGYITETHLRHWLLITQPCLMFKSSITS